VLAENSTLFYSCENCQYKAAHTHQYEWHCQYRILTILLTVSGWYWSKHLTCPIFCRNQILVDSYWRVYTIQCPRWWHFVRILHNSSLWAHDQPVSLSFVIISTSTMLFVYLFIIQHWLAEYICIPLPYPQVTCSPSVYRLARHLYLLAS